MQVKDSRLKNNSWVIFNVVEVSNTDFFFQNPENLQKKKEIYLMLNNNNNN